MRLYSSKPGPKIQILLAFILFSNISATAQQVFVSSRNSHEVKLYDIGGNFIENFVEAGSGGLSLPQEVLWHPDGFLLVTGRGNTAIKKYDGLTGAYLGNFTSGYALDNPTKTSIWQDSLLYISQWGQQKNKIARFDLKTGVFLDEFTNVGVPNACGHAWDASGNLLVAQYGNGTDGKVLKFDTSGILTSVFIPTTLLQGPVNLWFDEESNLLVADWTEGKVLKFDGISGGYILDKPADVTIEIRQISGQKVATLYSGKQTPGEHRIQWNCQLENGARAQPGVYVVTLWVSGVTASQKVILEG